MTMSLNSIVSIHVKLSSDIQDLKLQLDQIEHEIECKQEAEEIAACIIDLIKFIDRTRSLYICPEVVNCKEHLAKCQEELIKRLVQLTKVKHD